ncbi:hypothetical protein ABTM23_19480, partial [Acinetobacter baumannii]
EGLDPKAERLQLLRALEHNSSDGAEYLAISFNRDARDDAVRSAHALDGADFRFSGRNDFVQPGIVDDLLDWSANSVSGFETEECF